MVVDERVAEVGERQPRRRATASSAVTSPDRMPSISARSAESSTAPMVADVLTWVPMTTDPIDPSASTDPSQRVGFFGPFGTFTEQALRTQPDLAARELVAYRSVPDILDAVTAGEVGVGFVPIENSIEGMVNFTLDALAFDHDLIITRDVVLDIEHCLVARPGTTLADVKDVLSIPVATAQCHRFLREQLPGAVVRHPTRRRRPRRS